MNLWYEASNGGSGLNEQKYSWTGEWNELEYDKMCKQVFGDVQIVISSTVRVEMTSVEFVSRKRTEGSSGR